MTKSEISRVLRAVSALLDELSQAELEALSAGRGRLHFVFNDAEHRVKPQHSEGIGAMVADLAKCTSREEAQRVLGAVESKDRLISLAKAMKVHTVKNDRREDVESKIINFAIGGRLRSEALSSLNLGSGGGEPQSDGVPAPDVKR